MSLRASGDDMVSGKSVAAAAATQASELFEETENLPRAASKEELAQDERAVPQKYFDREESSIKRATMEEDNEGRSCRHRQSYRNLSPSDFLPPMAPPAAAPARTNPQLNIPPVLQRSTSHNTPAQQATAMGVTHHHFHPPRQLPTVLPSFNNTVPQDAPRTLCSPVDRSASLAAAGVFPSPAAVVNTNNQQWGLTGFATSSTTSPEQSTLDTAAAVAALLDLTPSVHGNEPKRGTVHGFAPPRSNVPNSASRMRPTLPSTMPPPPAVAAAPITVAANVVPAPPAAAAQDMTAYLSIASIDLASRSRQLLFDVPMTEKPCKCKNTHCLKLYCTCFQTGSFCNPSVCTCKGCENVEEFNGPSDSRPLAITQILKRRIDAFEPRLKKKTGEGCACKRSRCVMKYCDCFAIGALCTSTCTCTKCENSPTVLKAKAAGAKHKMKRKQS